MGLALVEDFTFSLISLGGAAIALGIGIRTYLRASDRRSLGFFPYAMVFFFASALGNLLLVGTVLPAGILNRFSYFCHMMSLGYLVLFLADYFKPFPWIHRHGVGLALQVTVATVAGVVASMVEGMQEGVGGEYGVTPSVAVQALTLASSAYLALSLILLGKVVAAGPAGSRRAQAMVMAIGLSLHGLVGAGDTLLRIDGGGLPQPLMAFSVTAMAALFSIAILNPWSLPLSGTNVLLKPGRAYMLHTPDSTAALRLAGDARATGRVVACITRVSPERVAEVPNLAETPTVWLTTNPGENKVAPSDLLLLRAALGEYLARSRDVLIVLQGLEYLALYNKFNDLVRFLHTLQDSVVTLGDTLLVSVDPTSLGAGEMAALDQGMELLQLPEGPPFVVEDLFVISRGGLLLARQSPRGVITKDQDAMAGMLTAIQAFVRETVSDAAPLRRVEVGNRKVLIEGGREIYVAVVITGQETPELVRELQSFVWRAENKFGDLIAVWDGSLEKLAGLEGLTKSLVAISLRK